MAQRSELRGEGSLYLTIRVLPGVEDPIDLVRAVTPVRVEGEQSEVLAADVAGQVLQLSLVEVADGAVATYELVDGGNERGRNAVRIEVGSARGLGQE